MLLTSQGSKPSAVAAYQIAASRPEVGLFYVPALEYNSEYSFGIRTDWVVQSEARPPSAPSMAHGVDSPQA